MLYFSNRSLALVLGINLSRWKRWCREFLPPDPLGGLQSGYARQLTVDDAFTVYVGGHLVSALKFNIPDARQSLANLHEWMAACGFYQIARPVSTAFAPVDLPVSAYQVYIASDRDGGFSCTVRGYLAETVTRVSQGRILEERHWEYVLGEAPSTPFRLSHEPVRLLNMTGLHRRFSKLLTAQT